MESFLFTHVTSWKGTCFKNEQHEKEDEGRTKKRKKEEEEEKERGKEGGGWGEDSEKLEAYSLYRSSIVSHFWQKV